MSKTDVLFEDCDGGIIDRFVGIQINPCARCNSAASLYEEGNAKRQYVADGTTEMWFTDVIAYVVECDECGCLVTSRLNMQDSIKKWNSINEIIL